MKDELLNKFYSQILFFSENGKSNIEHPGIMISEIEKMSGASRSEVIELFKKLLNIGFIEKNEEKDYALRIKTNITFEELKSKINASC
jgi:Fic family protein